MAQRGSVFHFQHLIHHTVKINSFHLKTFIFSSNRAAPAGGEAEAGGLYPLQTPILYDK